MSPFPRWQSKILLAVFILSGVFLFVFAPKSALALKTAASYQKSYNGTLTATDWNNLLYDNSNNIGFGDFVNTWLPAHMNGPLGIGMSTQPSADYSLQVVGKIYTDNLFSTGNVGLGLTNPSKLLHVAGQARFDSFAYGTTPVSTDTLALATVEYVNGSLSNGTGPWKRTAPYVYPSTLTDNVGIGVTNPGRKMVVMADDSTAYNADGGQLWLQGSTDPTYRLMLGMQTSASYGFIQPTKSGTAAQNLILNPGGGNVGIGVTDPIQKLDVNGGVNISSNVGIGKTNPAVRLEVSGGANVYGTNIYGNWTPDGNSLVKNWLLNDGDQNWNLDNGATIQTVANGKVGNKVIRSQAGLQSQTTSKGWIPIDPTKTYKISVWMRSGGTVTPDCTYLSGRQADKDLGYGTWGNGGWGKPYFLSCAIIPNTWTYYTTTIGANGAYSFDVAAQYFQVGSLMNYAPAENGYIEFQGFKFEELPTFLDTITSNLRVTGGGPHYISTGNVGIGTTTANKLLHVAGGVRFDSFAYGITPINTDTQALATVEYVNAKSGGPSGVGSGTTGQTLRHDGTGWVANSILFNNGTNVGVGVTNPTHKLQVGTGNSTSGSIFTAFGPSGTDVIEVGNNSGSDNRSWALRPVTNGINTDLQFYEHGLDGSRVTFQGNGGNVGIGTTNPQGRLHVGTTAYSTVNSSYQFNMFGPVNIMQRDTAADSFIINNAFFNSSNQWQRVLANGAGRIGWNSDATGAMDFKVAPTGAAGSTFSWINAMTILGDGNVGVGTTTPSKQFEVAGTGQAKFNSFAYGTTPVATDTLALATVEYVNSKSGGAGGVGTGVTGQTLRHNGTGWIANSTLYNNGTNVGIGVTNPTSKLYVSGNIEIPETKYLQYYTGANYYGRIMLWDGVSGNMVFDNKSGGTSHILFMPQGNVGIGTTNPSAKLQAVVTGTNTMNEVFRISSNNANVGSGASMVFGNIYGDNYPTWKMAEIGALFTNVGNFSSDLIFSTNGAGTLTGTTEKMRITSGGNVGIGTTAPNSMLNIGSQFDGNLSSNSFGSDVDFTIFQNAYTFNNAARTPGFKWDTTHSSFGSRGIRMSFFDGINFYADNAASTANTTFTPTSRMTITNSGNVGVGTSTPGKLLHVAGSAKFDSFAYGVTPVATDTLALATVEYVNGSLVNGTGPWKRTAPYIYPSTLTDNVGVGVTNPGYKLSVSGDIYTTGNIRLDGDLISRDNGIIAGQKAFQIRGVSTNSSYESGIAFDGFWYNGSSYSYAERMRITGAGNVGIGTTAPNGALQVGNNLTSTTLYMDNQTGYTSRGAKAWITYSASDTNQLTMSGGAGLTIHNNDTTDGNWSTLAFSSYEGASGNNVTPAAIRARTTNRTIGGWANGDLAFFTSPHTGLLERMRIDTNGNIGIGLTNPTYKLDVNGSARIVGADVDNTNLLTIYSNTGTRGTFAIRNGTNVNPSFLLGTVGSSEPLSFMTVGTEKVRITAAGNVGIGATGPAKLLQVAGQAKFDSFAYGTTPAATDTLALATVEYVNNKSGGAGGVGAGTVGQTLRHDGTGWVANSLIYNNGTNVGIGTTSPLAKLQVENAGVVAININDSSASQIPTINFQQAGTTKASIEGGVALSSRLDFSVNGYSRMMTLISGNVGVGTTGPRSRLDVNGGTPGAANLRLINLSSNGATQDVAMGLINDRAGRVDLTFGTEYGAGVWSERMRITNEGNLGVGTSTPAQRLHVQGGIGVNNSDLGVILSSYNTSATGYPQQFNIKHNNGNVEIRNERGNIGFTAGSIGIATTTPVKLLHVAGQAKFDSFAYGTTPVSTDTLALATVEYVNGSLVNGTGPWKRTAPYIYPSTLTDNIGIGTSTPTTKLHISAGQFKDILIGDMTGQPISAPDVATIGAGMLFTRTDMQQPDSGMAAYKSTSGGNNLVIKARGDIAFVSGNSNDERVRIKELGNVGIGTTNPTRKLHIYDGASGGVAHTDANLVVEDTSRVILNLLSNNTSDQYFMFGDTDVSNKAWLGYYHSTDRLELHTGGTISMDGNVGIGTINPAGRLDVSAGLGTQTAGDLVVNTVTNSVFVGKLDSASGNTKFIIRDRLGSEKLNIDSAGVGNIIMSMSGGNVGVGLTNPAKLLNVAGSAKFDNFAYGVTPVATDTLALATVEYVNGSLVNGTGPWKRTAPYVYPSTLSDNIGVGVTNPVKKLEVFGDIALSNGGKIGQGNGWGTNANSYNATLELYSGSTGYTTLQSATAYGLLLNPAGGNVGIGTTTPNFKFAINSTGPASLDNYDAQRVVFQADGTVNNLTSSAGHFINYLAPSSQSYSVGVLGEAIKVGSYGFTGTGVYGRGVYKNNSLGVSLNSLDLYGVRGQVSVEGTGANTINSGTAVYATANVDAGNTLSTLFGIYVKAPSGTGTITNKYALVTEAGAGNVGVGITNPRNLLDLGTSYGVGDAGRKLALYNDGTYFTGFSVHSGALGISSNTTAGQADSMTIITGGNVGVGTVGPTKLFNVAGQAKFDSFAYGVTPVATDTLALATVEYVNGKTGGSGGVGTGTAGQTLRHNGTGWVANSLLYNNGTNVGIGTTNPVNKLQVFGAVGNGSVTALRISNPTADDATAVDAIIFTHRQDTADDTTTAAAGRGGRIVSGRDGVYGGAWASNHNSNLQFYTALGGQDVERLRINSSGNVGIGTTNPSALLTLGASINTLPTNTKLWIAGAGGASNTVLQSRISLGFNNNMDYGGYIGDINVDSGVTHSILALGTRRGGTDVDAMYLTNGNVGIGTTAPSTKLSFGNLGADKDIVSIYQDTSGTAGIGTYGVAGLKLYSYNSSYDVAIGTRTGPDALSTKMIIKGTGNVGIGTTTPAKLLQVAGSAKFDNFAYGVTPVATDTLALATVEYVNGKTGGSGGVGTGTAGQTLRHNGTGWVANSTLYNNGTNVGIGITPVVKLDILGAANGLPAVTSTSQPNASARFGNSITNGVLDVGMNSGQAWLQATNKADLSQVFPILLNPNGGNIGVGTINPTSLLHVEPSTAAVTDVKIVGGGASGQRYTGPWLNLIRKGPYDDYGVKFYTESTLNWFVGVPYQGGSGVSYQKFIIGTSATAGTGTVATFDYLGNVGIGTTTPAKLLQVAGSAKFDSFAYGVTPVATDTLALATVEYVNGSLVNGTGPWKRTAPYIYPSTLTDNVGIGVTNPQASLQVNGGMIMKRTTVADADYTAQATDYIIGYTSISANRTVTLPNALCTPGRFFVVLDESGSASNGAKIIINPEGATPIVGQATFSLAGPYNSVYVFCGSSAWYVL